MQELCAVLCLPVVHGHAPLMTCAVYVCSPTLCSIRELARNDLLTNGTLGNSTAPEAANTEDLTGSATPEESTFNGQDARSGTLDLAAAAQKLAAQQADPAPAT